MPPRVSMCASSSRPFSRSRPPRQTSTPSLRVSLRRIAQRLKPRRRRASAAFPRHAARAVDGRRGFCVSISDDKRAVFVQIHFQVLLILKGARLRLCPNRFSPSLRLQLLHLVDDDGNRAVPVFHNGKAVFVVCQFARQGDGNAVIRLDLRPAGAERRRACFPPG